MAAPSPKTLYVNRIGLELEEDLEVSLTCAVQMFDFKDGKPVWNQTFFPSGTKVKLKLKESQAALAAGFKFYYVQAGTKFGYMPKSAFHDFVSAQFGESNYTGVSYGGDKWLKDGNGNFHSFPQDKEGVSACYRCGLKANKHKLYESQELAALLGSLSELLQVCAEKKSFTASGFMLGALMTGKDNYAVAYSGSLSTANFATFKDCVAKLDQKAAIAPALSGARYLSNFRQPQKYPARVLNKWHCAAPRLVQWAWHYGEIPFNLSEKWYGSKLGEVAIHGHTIKSCDDCRLELPYMLCGVAAWRSKG